MVIHMKCVYAFYPSTAGRLLTSCGPNASDNSVGPAHGITDRR